MPSAAVKLPMRTAAPPTMNADSVHDSAPVPSWTTVHAASSCPVVRNVLSTFDTTATSIAVTVPES